MPVLRKLRRLLDWPERIESELTAVRAALRERDDMFSAYREEIDAQLAFLRRPEDLRAAQRWIALRIRNGRELPDDLHETALRLELRHAPHDPQLTRSLVALLHRLDRPPIPDDVPPPSEAREVPPGEDLDGLVRAAGACARADDRFGVYAALWQACIRFPGDARGWAEYARCFAERYEWRNCRLAVERARAVPGVPGPAAVDALLAALAALAENSQIHDLDWKSWLERVPDALRVNANAVRLLIAAGDPRAASLAPRLLETQPTGAAAWLAAAMAAFEAERFSESYGYLRRAFAADPTGTFHTVVRTWSAPASELVEATGKMDELAAWLAERTVENPGLTLIPSRPAPEARLMAERERARARDRGLPSFLFVPLYKSASVSVHNIISSGFRLPMVVHSLFNLRVVDPWLAEFLRGGASCAVHLLPAAPNIDLIAAARARQVIVHVRDPRQVIISLVEHIRRYPRELPPATRKRLALPARDQIEAAIAEDLPKAVAWIDGWVKARDRLNVQFTTFEEFSRDRDAFVDRLVGLYGGETRYFDRADALRGGPDIDFHRRRGEADEWRRRLDPGQIERVNAQIPDAFWSLFGWTP